MALSSTSVTACRSKKISTSYQRFQYVPKPFQVSMLTVLLFFLFGCTNFASTTVVFAVANSRQANDTEATIGEDANNGKVIQPAIPIPGWDVPITSTLWILPFQSKSSLPQVQVRPEPLPAIEVELEPDVVETVDTSVSLPGATEHIDNFTEAQAEIEEIVDFAGLPGKIEHVVIITIDGLRPDALDLAHTPTLDDLRDAGAYSPQAQTVIPTFTLPSHVSMLSGVVPNKHHIVEALPCIGCRLEIGPTLFNIAHDAGLTTGAVFGKEKLGYLVIEESIDELLCEDVHDTEVKEFAIETIEAGLPNILFIHFPDTDRVGHEYGWMSENQLFAVNYADSMIGEIVAALEAGNYRDRTLLIISSDHGGHGFKHGDDSPVDRTIPWLAVGPGVPAGIILSSHIDTIDTAATAAHALNLPIPERWDGKPILEIFQ